MRATRNLLFSTLVALAAVALSTAQQPDAAIVDGESIDDPDFFPWFALYDGGGGDIICGGVLISKNRVLTSARCIRNGVPDDVRIGATKTDNGQKIGVKCGKRHPNYSSNEEEELKMENDLAVLYLAGDAVNDPVPSINTDVGYPSVKDQELATVGFGLTTQIDYPDDDDRRNLKSSEEDDDGLPDNLQVLVEKYVPIDKCQDEYPKDIILSGQHKCMKVKDGGGCSGDQGGPVLDMSKKLVGILTFAYGCADNDYSDVFMDVAHYNSWIHERINDECGTDVADNKTPAPTPSPTKPCKFDQIATDRIQAVKDRVGAVSGYLRARFSGGGTEQAAPEEGGDRV